MSKGKYNWILYLLSIIIIFTFIICYKYVVAKVNIKKYISSRNELAAITVVENHFSFLKNGKKHLAKYTLFSNCYNIKFNNIDYNVINIKEVPNDKLTYEYLNDIKMDEVKSFDVQVMNGNTKNSYMMRYIVCKEHKNSPWLIYAWGVSF